MSVNIIGCQNRFCSQVSVPIGALGFQYPGAREGVITTLVQLTQNKTNNTQASFDQS